MAPALLLAACGGRSKVAAAVAPQPHRPTSSGPVVVVPAAITATQASRFLAQATMGATRTLIDAVISRRYEGWIDDQFAMPRATSHWDWLVANGYSVAANINTETGFDPTIWRQLIASPTSCASASAWRCSISWSSASAGSTATGSSSPPPPMSTCCSTTRSAITARSSTRSRPTRRWART